MERRKHEPALIIDTKWKHLKTDAEDSRNGVKQSDLYQMFAYAHRYNCGENILLYPKVPGVSAKEYDLEGDSQGRRIHVQFLDVSYDLRNNRERLLSDIKQIVSKCRDIGGQEDVDNGLGRQASLSTESVVTKKRTRQEMHQLAEQNGVGKLYAALVQKMDDVFGHIEFRKSTVGCALDKRRPLVVMSIDLEGSSAEQGVQVRVMADRLARYCDFESEDVVGMLPGDATKKHFGRENAGTQYYFVIRGTACLNSLFDLIKS